MSDQQVNPSNTQSGALQHSSSTQHHDNSNGDSSEVTDQTSSQLTPHPLQGLPHRPHHHGNQQQLQDGAPSLANPQSNAVPHQHIPPSDRTLPPPQTLTCPSDGIQTSIQQPQGNSSFSTDSLYTDPSMVYRSAFQPNPFQSLAYGPPYPGPYNSLFALPSLPLVQRMIHPGGLANSHSVAPPLRATCSQSSSPFSETARTNQQNLPTHIVYPQAMPSQYLPPSSVTDQQQSSIQRPDSIPILTTGLYPYLIPHPHQNQGHLQHTSQQNTTYPPIPQWCPQQFFAGLNSLNQLQYYHNPHIWAMRNPVITGLPPPPVRPHYTDQSVYTDVKFPVQQSFSNQPTSNQSSANLQLLTVKPTIPQNTLASQPASLSGNMTDSDEKRSLLNPDTPDPKRSCLSPYSTSTTPSYLSEIEQPKFSMASPSTVAANCSQAVDNVFPSDSPAGSLPSGCQHHSSREHSPLKTASHKPKYNLVYQTLFPISSKWHNFGLALGLPEHSLKRIEHNYRECEDCLRETLAVRISDPKSLTWQMVLTALRNDTVKDIELAEKIEKEFSDQLDVQIHFDYPIDQDQLIKSKSPHSSSTAPRELETGLPEPGMTSLSTVASSYTSCDNSSVVGLPSSSQKHSSKEYLDASLLNSSPTKPTFNIVYDRLIPICSEWHNFGLALGLTPNKLKEIDDNKMCKNSLRETLSVRINDKPLTWRDVVNALRTDTVKNNELADEIESEFSEPLDVPIQLDDPADQGQGFENTSTPTNLPDCVLRYASYLKDKYKRMPVLPDTWPPPLVGQDHFTNLALIEKRKYLQLPQAKSKRSIQYDYAYGNIDNIIERKQAIKLENLFEPLPGEDSTQNQFIILMDGAPGVGKTTISRKICKDWSRDELRIKFNLVIFLPLRELFIACCGDSSLSLSDLLDADDPELKHQVLQYMQRTSGDGVLYIFDGFDELSFDQRTKQSLFLDIVKGKRLHKCSVLVTSRTYASGPLREISRINRHVEVLGFKKRQIDNCIKKNIAEKEKAKQLLEMLKERLDIISLCYIPLNCRIVLYVYQQQYTLPDTLTELYEVFILYTMKHYTGKISSEEEIVVQIKQANSLEKLPEMVVEHLHNLTQVAYTGLTQDRLVFEYSELGVAKGALSLGLLNMIDTTTNDREEHYYQFLHFTIQEFLAAKYLAEKLSSDKQLQFVKSNVDADRFRITLLFLAGLTGLNFIHDKNSFSVQPLIKLGSFSKQPRIRFLFFAQLLYESRRKTCDWLLSCLEENKLYFVNLTHFDCIVLAYLLSVTPKDYVWDKIEISNLKTYQLKLLFCKLHVETNAPILSTTKSLDIAMDRKSDGISFSWLLPLISGCSKVEEFLVSQFNQSEKSSCQLSPIPKDVFTFKKFEVGQWNGYVTDTELNLKRMSLFICPKLLSMFFKFLDPKKATSIDLRNHPEIFQDCLRCNTFSSVIWKSLYAALDTFENLQKLAIPTLNTENAFSLINNFSGNQLVIDFSDSLIRPEELINLRNHLAQAQMTTILFRGLKLSLENNATFTIKVDSAIANSQHCLGYLRTLLGEKLPPNFIKFDVTCSFLTEDMGKWLGSNSDLKELKVDLVSESVKYLSIEFSSALAQCVSHSATLEVLKIENCELTDNQLKTISKPLLHNPSLKELHFQRISFKSIRSLSVLFQAVQKNTSLCKLDCNTTTLSRCTYSGSCRALCDMITNNTVLQELSINAQYIGREYKMFVNTLLQSTTARLVTVGRYSRDSSDIELFKEGLSKYGGDKIQVTSRDCWTLGLVTLNFKRQ